MKIILVIGFLLCAVCSYSQLNDDSSYLRNYYCSKYIQVQSNFNVIDYSYAGNTADLLKVKLADIDINLPAVEGANYDPEREEVGYKMTKEYDLKMFTDPTKNYQYTAPQINYTPYIPR